MNKLILWLVVAAIVIYIGRQYNRMRAQARTQAPSNNAAPAASLPGERMVQCAHCGIYLPQSEAIKTGGHTWCSPEHASLGPAPSASRQSPP